MSSNNCSVIAMFNALYCYTNVLQLVLFLFVPIFVSNQSLKQRGSCVAMSQLLSKKHSDAYEEFFTSPGLVCLVEAFLEFFDMETILKVSQLKTCHRRTQAWRARSTEHIDNMLERFVNYHAFHLGVTVDDKV